MEKDLGVAKISKYAISALATAKKEKKQQSTVRIQSKASLALKTYQMSTKQVDNSLLCFICWLIVIFVSNGVCPMRHETSV